LLRGVCREKLLVEFLLEFDIVVRKRGLLAAVPRVMALNIVVDKTEFDCNVIDVVDSRR
jgi:hypothetical protein